MRIFDINIHYFLLLNYFLKYIRKILIKLILLFTILFLH